MARNESCAQAARLMREHHVGSLMVVRENAADDLIELFGEEMAGLASLIAAGPRREREQRRAAL